MRRCLFKLQDSARLAAAAAKLRRARACLAAAHGAELERLRVLHGDFQPELAMCALDTLDPVHMPDTPWHNILEPMPFGDQMILIYCSRFAHAPHALTRGARCKCGDGAALP